ncbi:2-phospho-L-lactate guanylyltransferase [Solirubrobacter soli]|uniref:2-phospho-L-lactate guanylyltransferase n=1 Tax=Solirubrobacter soli TaxID=363832 RepID=UPI0004095908|nr:2-phospho-L-lactate guanylyltransferase [Solirubrobacter soli]
MRTVAILPVKSFGRAKQRLTGGFDDRPGLAAAMVADVLDALDAVPELDGVIVVTAQAVSARTDVVIVHDPVEAGQSAAAARGIATALERGFERVLLVPGDCPALDPAEVSALLAHQGDVVIVPDRHGTGTNSLLLTPPDVMAPAFGEGSFARHERLAAEAGASFVVAEASSLELDVDTPDDLAALRRALAARPGGAVRTRRVLEDAAVA